MWDHRWRHRMQPHACVLYKYFRLAMLRTSLHGHVEVYGVTTTRTEENMAILEPR